MRGNDIDKYSINFGNITDPEYTRSLNFHLNLWSNREVIITFGKEEIQVEHSNFSTDDVQFTQETILPGKTFPLPLNTKIIVLSNLGDSLNLDFTTDVAHSYPIPLTIPMCDTNGNPIKDSNGNTVTEFRII